MPSQPFNSHANPPPTKTSHAFHTNIIIFSLIKAYKQAWAQILSKEK